MRKPWYLVFIEIELLFKTLAFYVGFTISIVGDLMRRSVKTILLILIMLMVVFHASRSAIEKPSRRLSLSSNSSIKFFESYEELICFIEAGNLLSLGYPAIVPLISAEQAIFPILKSTFQPRSIEYSKTNVQVPGVDEADIVKTNGLYLFLASENRVYILKAYPPSELSLASMIILEKGYTIKGLFISGDRLVVIASTTHYKCLLEGSRSPSIKRRPVILNTTVVIYDISNIDEPALFKCINVTGSYIGSRLIDNFLYVVVSHPTLVEGEVFIPLVNGVRVQPASIGYSNLDIGTAFTIVIAVDISSGEFSKCVFLTSYSSYLYMSRHHLYLLFSRFVRISDELMNNVLSALSKFMPQNVKVRIDNVLGENTSSTNRYRKAIGIIAEWLSSVNGSWKEALLMHVREVIVRSALKFGGETSIYKFRLDGLNITAIASTIVPGTVFDQFSMDEWNGYFRIATTELGIGGGANYGSNVYVLDENLSVIGKLEGLAIGERIYAARYLGDLMFLVTFRRVDPLYGIDLSDPRNPRVVGFLKIPGYSEYLHPLGDKYLIGIGVGGSWTGSLRGIRISLFDISDPSNIREISSIDLGSEYCYSPVLRDHKAFTLNAEDMYFMVPILSKVSGGIYVVDVDIASGKLSLRGVVELDGAIRSIYIDDFIYAISLNRVVVVDEGLNLVGELLLPK